MIPVFDIKKYKDADQIRNRFTYVKCKEGSTVLKAPHNSILNFIYSLSGEPHIRTNSVLAVRLQMIARNIKNEEEADNFVFLSEKWCMSVFGENKIYYSVRINDKEDKKGFKQTILEVMFIPINEKNRLSATFYFGNRFKLSALQDSFYGLFGKLGVKRGVKRTVADHKDVDAYYDAGASSWEDAPVPVEGETVDQYMKRAQEVFSCMNLKMLYETRMLQSLSDKQETYNRRLFPRQKNKIIGVPGERTRDLIIEEQEIRETFKQLKEYEKLCEILENQSYPESNRIFELVERAVEVGKI